MLTTEDFTLMPEGLLVPLAGRVGRCPRCARTGVEARTESGMDYVHVQTSEVMCDGMLVEPQDCCVTLPNLPVSLSLVLFES
jgi:hypothetical protein